MKQLIAILYGQSHRVTLSEVITALILALKAPFITVRDFYQANKKAIGEIIGTALTFIMLVAFFLTFIFLFK